MKAQVIENVFHHCPKTVQKQESSLVWKGRVNIPEIAFTESTNHGRELAKFLINWPYFIGEKPNVQNREEVQN